MRGPPVSDVQLSRWVAPPSQVSHKAPCTLAATTSAEPQYRQSKQYVTVTAARILTVLIAPVDINKTILALVATNLAHHQILAAQAGDSE